MNNNQDNYISPQNVLYKILQTIANVLCQNETINFLVNNIVSSLNLTLIDLEKLAEFIGTPSNSSYTVFSLLERITNCSTKLPNNVTSPSFCDSLQFLVSQASIISNVNNNLGIIIRNLILKKEILGLLFSLAYTICLSVNDVNLLSVSGLYFPYPPTIQTDYIANINGYNVTLRYIPTSTPTLTVSDISPSPGSNICISIPSNTTFVAVS